MPQPGGSFPKGRAMTPKGQMSSSGSGPAIMMMPPHIRATFMPNPPPKPLPPLMSKAKRSKDRWYRYHVDHKAPNSLKKKHDIKLEIGTSVEQSDIPLEAEPLVGLTGVARYLAHFEKNAPPRPKAHLTVPQAKRLKRQKKAAQHERTLQPLIEEYMEQRKTSKGEFQGMNCYNTLFVGRLAYETTERKLLREFEAHGPIKDLKLIFERDPNGDAQNGHKPPKSRGYAFIEYEREDDMRKAYKYADAMKLDGRAIVVDVERGHTVPTFLPRRLGGGLGDTRATNKPSGAMAPGRHDKTMPTISIQPNTVGALAIAPHMPPMSRGSVRPPFGAVPFYGAPMPPYGGPPSVPFRGSLPPPPPAYAPHFDRFSAGPPPLSGAPPPLGRGRGPPPHIQNDRYAASGPGLGPGAVGSSRDSRDRGRDRDRNRERDRDRDRERERRGSTYDKRRRSPSPQSSRHRSRYR